jgi:hypothetical protein
VVADWRWRTGDGGLAVAKWRLQRRTGGYSVASGREGLEVSGAAQAKMRPQGVLGSSGRRSYYGVGVWVACFYLHY